MVSPCVTGVQRVRSPETTSLSNSNRFPFSSVGRAETPVTFPSGRARLATSPAATGSPALTMTMGIVLVALFAANADKVEATTITSTLSWTSSAASSGQRSGFPLKTGIQS